MNKKTLIVIVVPVIAIFGLLFVVYNLTNSPSTPVINQQVNVIGPQDHLTWSAAKKNILVEYSDFQCPACRNFHIIINQMVASGSADAKIRDKVTFIYRNFPLPQHPNANAAAYAAEAAGRQGKFYEMSDLLFNNQDNWKDLPNSTDYFVNLAKQLSLNTEQFKTDMNSQAVKEKVSADLDSGNQARVDATPTFYLNGQKLDNIQSFNQFKSLLNSL